MALFAAVFILVGAGGTYLVMDRVVPALTDSDDGVELADTDPVPEPSETPEPSPTPTPVEPTEDEDPNEADPSADPSEDPDEDLGPGERLLTQMDPVDTGGGIWEPDRAEINGEVHHRVLLADDACQFECDPAAWAEYNLSRSWDTFAATIGMDDNSISGQSVTFSVYADGEAVSTETLALGETIDIEVDVTDVLRMRLEVAFNGLDVYPVWSEPTLTSD